MNIATIGRALVAILGVTTVGCLLPIVVVQILSFVRHLRRRDDLQQYRLAISSLVLCGTVIMIWRMAIWLDVTFAHQYYLGVTTERWPTDLAIGVICQIFAAYPTYIFWRDRFKTTPPKGDHRKGRGS